MASHDTYSKEQAASDRHNIDMLDTARVAQHVVEDEFSQPGAIKVIAPAKVNLYLEIKDRRTDGYHNVNTIMHTLLLHDLLFMKLVPFTGERVKLTVRSCEGVEPIGVPLEQNIVAKAINLLAQESELSSSFTVRVHLDKHIPSQAGLGGGSSDAAAALIGAMKLWNMSLEKDELISIAAELGADVPFFLEGGCQRFVGKGDELAGKLSPLASSVVVIKPAGGVSTSEAYRGFDQNPISVRKDVQERANAATLATDVPLENNMSASSQELLPDIGEIIEWASGMDGVKRCQMAGSGAAVFLECPGIEESSQIVAAARQKGWWARSTSYAPVRAMVMPRR